MDDAKSRFERTQRTKKVRPSYDVWSTMSVRDVARTLDRSPDDIFELLLMMPGTDYLR